MTLIQRFSILFTFLFSVLLGSVMLTVYYSFKYFRQQEFHDRLLEKAETNLKLLLEVKEIDYRLLKIIDKNSVNRLYNRQVLVFNNKMQLIYSSTDDKRIKWGKKELLNVKNNKLFFRKSKAFDIIASHYKVRNKDYYIVVSAEDKYGNMKLYYLKYILFIAFLSSSFLIWILSFYLSRSSLKPLDKVRKEIQEITDKNLNKRLPEPQNDDELKALSNSFNQMMDRIDRAYQRQKEFTGNASHELRTPIAKILAQLENVLLKRDLPEKTKEVLQSIIEDTSQLSEIVTSLLLLSEIDNREGQSSFTKVRLDEVVFNSASRISKMNKDLKFQFEIENIGSDTISLEVDADETLLQIAFNNLIRNAYLYSDNRSVKCVISQSNCNAIIVLTNSGNTPNIKDTSTLFNTFSRGSNIGDKSGSGVGLSIVKRILHHHNALIEYNIPSHNINKITIIFPSIQIL